MEDNCAKLTKLTNTSWQAIESSRDVLSDIFSKLPAVDLMRCKCVSSTWFTVLRCPKLAEKQLTISKQDPLFLLYPVDEMEDNVVYLVDTNGSVIKSLEIPGLENLSPLSMNCCYNGLVCITNFPWRPDSEKVTVDVMDLEIRICNPSTRQLHVVPPGSPSVDEPEIGVAFGPTVSEYKVFRIYHSEPKSAGVEPLCEVYTPQSGAWRSIGNVPKCPKNSNNVFVNGKLYWFVPSSDDIWIADAVMVVDMEENFRLIELPEEVTAHAFLLELDGHLGMVAIYDDHLIMDVWLLKYNGASENWEKKTSDYIPYSVTETTDSVAAIRNKIFLITSEHYYIYDIETRVWLNLPFASEFEGCYTTVFPFSGSILPCNGVMGPGY